jgi:hypothetical protein
MSDETLFVDTTEVFTAVADLRAAATAPPAPSLNAPDVGQAALTDSLGRLSTLARALAADVDAQIALIGNAINQGSIDVAMADADTAPEFHDVPTGTTSTSTTTTAPPEPPAAADPSDASESHTSTGTTTTTTTVPGG